MVAATMDRENDGVSSSHDKKKRKLADTSFDDDNSTYHVKMEVAPSATTTFPRDANENDGSWLHDDGTSMTMIDGTVAMGVGHDISHPNIPLSANSTSSNNGRLGLGITNPNINGGNGISTTYGNVPFIQDPSLGSLATRRSLTGPPPTISSLSRRNVSNLPSCNSSNGNNSSPALSIGSSKLAKPTNGSISGGKQQTGPPCPCLADPTATQFVAHLTRNVRSTVEFLETRHRASPSNGGGDDAGRQRSPVEDPLVKTVHECGVMRALAQLDKSIRCALIQSFFDSESICSFALPQTDYQADQTNVPPVSKSSSNSHNNHHHFNHIKNQPSPSRSPHIPTISNTIFK
ncbi:hypothetical protein BS47DRAFT_235107 [Hydnum rufescens UP504]|uniref:Uncharacterized protein n=1 Tax=Hydnum rufescens UP504 TaxID=1448309 RepID=A0A9P6AN35_9AGAM|nr:hypothetical protein BS47DRAFT_235107 [Hydnum rufescens UP504]